MVETSQPVEIAGGGVTKQGHPHRHLTAQAGKFCFLVGRQSVAPARVNLGLLDPQPEGLWIDAQVPCHLSFRKPAFYPIFGQHALVVGSHQDLLHAARGPSRIARGGWCREDHSNRRFGG